MSHVGPMMIRSRCLVWCFARLIWLRHGDFCLRYRYGYNGKQIGAAAKKAQNLADRMRCRKGASPLVSNLRDDSGGQWLHNLGMYPLW